MRSLANITGNELAKHGLSHESGSWQSTSRRLCKRWYCGASQEAKSGIANTLYSGSGGFMSDLTFNGGQNAAFFSNQQFTVRNFTVNNANNAINMAWDWGL